MKKTKKRKDRSMSEKNLDLQAKLAEAEESLSSEACFRAHEIRLAQERIEILKRAIDAEARLAEITSERDELRKALLEMESDA
jgi:hypothetical protein